MAQSYILDGNIVGTVDLSADDYNALVESDTMVRIIKDMLATPNYYISDQTLSLIVGYKAQEEVKKDDE